MTDLYAACTDLFNRYPLAVSDVTEDGSVRSMDLAVVEGDDAAFYFLSLRDNEHGTDCSLWPWAADTEAIADMKPGDAGNPAAADIVARALPIPRDGSLFAWVDAGTVTAVVAFHSDCSPKHPDPTYQVMPLAGSPETEWPPFTGEPVLGPWVWECVASGQLAPLNLVIAGTDGAVFWSGGCLAIASDVAGPGFVLTPDVYVYYQQLRAGVVSSLETLLADPGVVDLAPRFQRYYQSAAS